MSLVAEVERFLFEEARRMDENRYADWLALFTADALYWIPSNRADIDPSREVSILYAPRPILEAHVRRLQDGAAFAQVPASRLSRMVGNVTVQAHADRIEAQCVVHIVELRRHVQRLHAARCEYTLRRQDVGEGEALRIASKKVVLLGIDEPQDNVTFLL